MSEQPTIPSLPVSFTLSAGLIDSGAGAGIDTGSFAVEYKVLVLDVPENTSARPGPPPVAATVLENTVAVTGDNVPDSPMCRGRGEGGRAIPDHFEGRRR